MSGFDPFQIFQVSHKPCTRLQVTILNGRNITKGRVPDFVDTPDPYIILVMKESPNGRRQTSGKDNDTEPVWNETFSFFLNSDMENVLELTLMDSNYTVDGKLCTKSISLSPLPMQGKQRQTVKFNETSEVDIEMWAEVIATHELDYSLALCEEEKAYVETRRKQIHQAMCNVLGLCAPPSDREVPVIGVLGSGGGFRAMTAYSGVMAALADSGILDMVTYTAGLSGSAWYLSYLYSHPDFPQKRPGELSADLRSRIDSSPFKFLKPHIMMRNLKMIKEKLIQGQPVSFTDFFGEIVGDTLLKGRLDMKLSDQQAKLQDGKIPMPLYTCLHVKKEVSAKIFHEWIEFSPYVIGMPKYGIFMKPELFGCKFFMGKIVQQFPEPPLHFLQGIWGSAYSIQFNRLLEDHRKIKAEELMKQEREELEIESDSSSLKAKPIPHLYEGLKTLYPEIGINIEIESGSTSLKAKPNPHFYESLKSLQLEIGINIEMELHEDMAQEADADSAPSEDEDSMARIPEDAVDGAKVNGETPSSSSSNQIQMVRKHRMRLRRSRKMSSVKQQGWWDSMMGKLMDKSFMQTIEGRAAMVYNFMRGLSLNDMYPISPFSELVDDNNMKSTPEDCTDSASKWPSPDSKTSAPQLRSNSPFEEIFEKCSTHLKGMYVVDGGLAFNSPFPLLLRPQRNVDLLLSFDFSARPSDNSPLFEELLLAAKWAKLNNVPFPPIDPTVVDREGLKECYIFRDPKDPHCPVVMHFVLVNITFRNQKAPGVPRETPEEKAFGDFHVFDDPERPYSTFNFRYSHQDFDRLTQLAEFNTLLHVEDIKNEIRNCIRNRHSVRRHFNLEDIKTLSSRHNLDGDTQRALEGYIRSLDLAELNMAKLGGEEAAPAAEL